MNAKQARARKTRKHQRNPNAGATFHPRSLFRGLTVPWSNKPGQKYLHPERHRTGAVSP